MFRTLFFILWIIIFFVPQVCEGIEIYANGHKYDSLQAYHASSQPSAIGSLPAPVFINSQQEDEIRKEAKRLGVPVDLSKVKTLQIGQSALSDTTRHNLYVLSVENGVVDALRDFYLTWGQPDFQMQRSISTMQLQEAIAQAVTQSKYPKLLISKPGKIRIMDLDNSEGNFILKK